MTYEEARAKAYEVTYFPLSLKLLDNCEDIVWVAGYSPYSKEGLYTLHSKPAAGCCSQTEAILLNKITEIIKPTLVVEIGSYIGWSTIHLAEHSRLVIAVDDFREGKAKEVFQKNVRLAGFNNISLVQKSSDDYFSQSPFNADIIFIDGWHIDGQPIKDVYGAMFNIKPNGWIILHDTWFEDVRIAGDYLIAMGYKELIFDTDNKLAIYHKDGEVLQWLLNLLQ